jgi:hypothetical protein
MRLLHERDVFIQFIDIWSEGQWEYWSCRINSPSGAKEDVGKLREDVQTNVGRVDIEVWEWDSDKGEKEWIEKIVGEISCKTSTLKIKFRK